MKRQRGRGRKSGGNQQNRSFESNGPDVKIRGNASTIYEKYLQLARDASSSGDRVMAENYYQHAEHYFRIVQANQPKRDERQDDGGQHNKHGGGDQRGQQDQGDQQGRGGQDQDDRQRGRGRDRRDDRPDEGQRGGEGRREDQPAQPEAGKDEKGERPRRGRRRKEEAVDASDPLAVVNPEGEGENQSGGSELTGENSPKPRKPRAPRKPRGDKAAQEALDKVGDGEGSTGSGGDKDSEAA